MGVPSSWNGLWNGLMEWTDGMEYQLPKIAKTHIMAVVKLKVLSHHCSLLHVDEAMFLPWMSGDVCVNWNEPKVCCT